MINIKHSILLCVLVFLVSCTVKTTKVKNPVFSNINKTKQDLMNLVKAENINLNGREITVNKETTTDLEIDITNGINIPSNDEERKALGKSIAKSVKSNLTDPKEYDKYTVLFIKKVEGDFVSKRNWSGNVFNSNEL